MKLHIFLKKERVGSFYKNKTEYHLSENIFLKREVGGCYKNKK